MKVASGSRSVEPAPLRAVADDDQPGAGHLVDLDQAAYAVAPAQPADVADHDPRPAGGALPRPAGVQRSSRSCGPYAARSTPGDHTGGGSMPAAASSACIQRLVTTSVVGAGP